MGKEAHLHIPLFKKELPKRPEVILVLEQNAELVAAAKAAGIDAPGNEWSQTLGEKWVKVLEAYEAKNAKTEK